MSGLPYVATSATPAAAESYLPTLDKRLLALEREYEGPARGTFSHVAVRAEADLPLVPDGAVGYVVTPAGWWTRLNGAWVYHGAARPVA